MLVMEGWVINEGMSLLLHVLSERVGGQRLEEELEQTAALLQGSPKECDPHREQLQGLDGPEGRPRALMYTLTCTAVLRQTCCWGVEHLHILDVWSWLIKRGWRTFFLRVKPKVKHLWYLYQRRTEAGAVRIKSITKTFTLGCWMLPRTSLLSRLRGDSYEEEPGEKSAKRNCRVLKEPRRFKKKKKPCFFFSSAFWVFYNSSECSHAQWIQRTSSPVHSQPCALAADEGGQQRRGRCPPLISAVTSATELLLILWGKGHALVFTHMHTYCREETELRVLRI